MTNYAKINEGYDVREVDSFTPKRYRQFFRHLALKGEETTIIDVGCNSGVGGQVLKELDPQIQLFGLDCVPTNLEKLPQNVYSQRICSDSTTIPLADNSIQRIVSGEFIEHLYEDDVQKTLHEFCRILQPGGKLLLTTPNPDYLVLKLKGQSVIGGSHVSEHSAKKLKARLEEVGFVNIQILGSGKASNFLGENFPLLAFYGSYLLIADKPKD
jgi:ubiquinone/menaquinone biosynthesis C-methylase UbiE